MPIAVGECHVNGVAKAYVANLVSGMVTAINVDTQKILGNIPVTLRRTDKLVSISSILFRDRSRRR